MNSYSCEEGFPARSVPCIANNDNHNLLEMRTAIAEDNNKLKTIITTVERHVSNVVAPHGISSSHSCPESLATEHTHVPTPTNIENTVKTRKRVDIIRSSFIEKTPSKKASLSQVLPIATLSSPLIVSPTIPASITHLPELQIEDVEQQV